MPNGRNNSSHPGSPQLVTRAANTRMHEPAWLDLAAGGLMFLRSHNISPTGRLQRCYPRDVTSS